MHACVAPLHPNRLQRYKNKLTYTNKFVKFCKYSLFCLHNSKKSCKFAADFNCGIVAIRKNIVLWLLCSVLCIPVAAQVSNAGRSVFSFMSLPVSAHINALGGSSVSLSDGDIALGMCNPALLHEKSHMVLQLNYSYYLPGTMFGSALYGHNYKLNYFAAGIHYLDYGRMLYTDEKGDVTGGTFGARDILIDIIYARQLHPCWKIGVTMKPVYSIYEAYSSFAIGADVGAHFQTRDSTFQMGLVLANIGWQLKGFYSEEGGSNHEMLPLNLQLGLTYRVKKAPLRFHMQIHNMQTWYLNYEWTSNDKSPVTGDFVSHDIPWYDMLFRHTIFALEVIPKSEKFYVSLSYNHRRRAELNLIDQRSLAGFALGLGVRIKQARIDFAVSQLTKSNFSYQAGLTLDINSLLK